MLPFCWHHCQHRVGSRCFPLARGRDHRCSQSHSLTRFWKTLLVKCWSDVGHHVGQAKRKGQDLRPDLVLRGGDDGIRTHDPHVANVMLSQLSYIPTCMCAHAQKNILRVATVFVNKMRRSIQFQQIAAESKDIGSRLRHYARICSPASSISRLPSIEMGAGSRSASMTKGANSGSPFCDSSTVPVKTSTYWYD